MKKQVVDSMLILR